nr:hypothetical protein [Tanacetum cinerariifolium]
MRCHREWNSFKLVAQTRTNDAGTSTTLIPGPLTTKEKAQKKNDVKARSMLLMTLPNEHLMTFNQYKDATTLFTAIQTRFGGNEATKKTQKTHKTLLRQMYENFSAPRTKKITINGNDTAGYDMSKVECFNYHKLGHFARECRQRRNQDSRNWNQDSSIRNVNVEDTSSNAMVAIDGAGFDWSFMVDDEVPINMALMAFSDSESLDKLIGSQIPDNSKKGMGYESYHVVSPPPTGLFLPLNLDLSNSGLEEFQQPEFESYRPKTSKNVSENISNEVKESLDAPLVKQLVSDDKLEKTNFFPTSAKKEFVRPKQKEKLVRKPVNYDKMYRSQCPMGNQRNWNNQKSQHLGSDFVMERVVFRNNYTRVNYNYSTRKAHPSAYKNMAPRAVLIKTGPRPVNTVRPVNTAHPKTIVYSARPMSHFSKSTQSTVKQSSMVRFREMIQYNLTTRLTKLMLLGKLTTAIDVNAVEVKTVDGEKQIQAIVDKKMVIITEKSVRSDLHLEDAEANQALEIRSLKRRVTKLENKASKITHKLKLLYKIGSSTRVESSEDAVLGDQEDASKQGRMIEDLDADEGVALVDETHGKND